MPKDLCAAVTAFQKKQGITLPARPTIPAEDTITLGLDLIKEELGELEDAVAEDDIVGVADALTDLLYVTAWMSNTWGLPMVELLAEVQRANMDKFGPGSWKREDGKQMKPATWQPPDIIGVLRKAIQGG